MRGFEKISKHKDNEDIILPTRGTKNSAGYDFYLPESVIIKANESVKILTGIKSYFLSDETLSIYPRSSLGIKKGVMLKNTVGIVDSDYYNNRDNEGEIIICLRNTSNENITLKKGERFAQGIFSKILLADNDIVISEKRIGGIGSTGTH